MLALQALYFFWYSHCSCRTRSRPRLNVKTHVGLFPCKIKTAHAACGLYLVGADLRLTDGLAVTHTSTCCLFSQHTHKHAGKWTQRVVFHSQTVFGSLCCLWGKQISTITYSIKPSAGCKQQADRSPTWPHVTVSDRSYILSINQEEVKGLSLAFC